MFTEHYEHSGLSLSFVLPGLFFCFSPGSGTMRDYPQEKAIPNVHCFADNIKLIS
jgi:hypothetical protein